MTAGYLIRDDEELFSLASRVMEMAERGEARLHLSPLTAAEPVWVLDSFYDYVIRQKERLRYGIMY
ncbi:MAG TPA: type II toxin-antitoxin system VapC family toxin [Syntrophomonadaceae bacterium]|nr:type II toxin-antitoxin system VapC family toxin [Syntrophomonadaceae bacterium]